MEVSIRNAGVDTECGRQGAQANRAASELAGSDLCHEVVFRRAERLLDSPRELAGRSSFHGPNALDELDVVSLLSRKRVEAVELVDPSLFLVYPLFDRAKLGS